MAGAIAARRHDTRVLYTGQLADDAPAHGYGKYGSRAGTKQLYLPCKDIQSLEICVRQNRLLDIAGSPLSI